MREGEKYRLGDLCEIIKGETPIKQAIPGNYPLVVTAAERASHEVFQFDCRAVIVPLVSSTGHGHASIKRINYQEGKFALGSILCAVIPKDEKRLSAKFLHIYFSYFKDQLIVPLMKGSANVSLSIKALTELKIIVPPITVQQRVISLAENDALMKPLAHEVTHQQALLSKLKQAILQDAIKGKLTADWRDANPDVEPTSQLLQLIQAEKARLTAAKKLRPGKPLPKITSAEIPFDIPKGWEWCRLGIISTATIGLIYKPEQVGEIGVPVLRANSIVGSEITLNGLIKVNAIVPNNKMAEIGDILICVRSGSKALIGKCAIIKESGFSFGAFMTLLRSVYNPYLFHFLLSAAFRNQIDDQKSTGINQLTQTTINNVVIPLPPISEQAAIVERVEELMQYCKHLENEISGAKNNAEMLMQAVLKEAFSGE